MPNRKNEVTFSVKGLVDLDTSQLISKLNNAKTSLGKLSMPTNVKNSFTTLFNNIIEQINDFEQKSKKTFSNMGEIREAEKSYAKLEQYIEQLNFAISKVDMSKLSLKDKNAVQGLEKGLNVLKDFDTKVDETTKDMTKLQNQLSKKLQSKIDVSNLVEAAKSGQDLGRQLSVLKGQNTKLKVDSIDFAKAQKEINLLTQQLDEARIKRDQLHKKASGTNATDDDTKVYLDQKKAVTELASTLTDAKRKQTELYQNNEAYKSNKEIINQLIQAYEQLKNAASIDFSQIFGGNEPDIHSIDELKNKLESLKNINLTDIQKIIDNIGKESEEASHEVRNMGQAFGEVENSASDLQNVNNQINSLTENCLQFFSLTNGWYLLRRAIQSAYETVKELDASMTEIAVVSDYTLDEIWSMRKEYSDAATDMGAKTIDLVDATKLYVQQGLDLQESMEVGIETTKMARIANLDGAEATNLMTSALRGFNMEMTEANRVNDVYSELAAKSAADTEEIATAMSKTASIANNAGASFENTAAFLTQIIETTREAPETAGTALKTVIARFQELKKPMSEIGEVDGEMVDANKIETALKEAGVALRDVNGEFRNFDDVILELASKWDSLDKMTQRYIATQAAGSRQQSRFLALMEDNERLLELTGYAANSAGAATEQFNKTLDSLESKINKMNNAIDIFFTNLANNDIIKGAIDLFTQLLDVINSIVGVFANSQSTAMNFIGSLIQVALIALAFKGADKLIRSFAGHFVSSMNETGSKAGDTLLKGIEQAFNKNGVRKLSLNFVKTFSEEIKKNGKNSQTLLDIFGMTKNNKDITNFVQNNKDNIVKDFKNAINFNSLQDNEKKEVENLINSLKASNSDSWLKSLQADYQTRTGKQDGFNINNLPDISTIDKLSTKFNTAAAAAGGFGISLGIVSSLLKESGYEEAAENVDVLTNGFMGVTLAIEGVNGAMQAYKIAQASALGPALPYILGIAAAIGAVVIAFKLVNDAIETPAEKIERLNEQSKKLKANLDNLNNSQDELNTSLDEFRTAREDLDSMIEGTEAWNKKLIETNSLAIQLIEKMPQLKNAFTIGENGAYQLDESKIANIQDEIQNQIINTQNAIWSNERQISKDNFINEAKQELEDYNIKLFQAQQELSYPIPGVKKESLTSNNNLVTSDNSQLIGEAISNTENLSYAQIENLIKYAIDSSEENKNLALDFGFSEKQLEGFSIYLKESSTNLKDFSDWLFKDQKKLQQIYQNALIGKEGSQETKDEVAEAFSKSNNPEEKTKYDLRSWGNDIVSEELKKQLNSYVKDSEILTAEEKARAYTNEKEGMSILYKRFTGAEYDWETGGEAELQEILWDLIYQEEQKSQISSLLEKVNTNENLGDLFSGSAQKFFENTALQKITKDNIDEYINTLNLSTVEEKNAVKEQYNKMSELQKNLTDFLENIGKIDKEAKPSLDYDTTNILYNLNQQIKDTLGEDFSDSFKGILTNLNNEELEQFSENIEDLDFSSSIKAAKQLKQGIENAVPGMTQLAVLLSGSTIIDTQSQLDELTSSMGNAIEELNEDGTITASEMVSLGGTITDFMDNTGISANTLAKYFEKTKNGIIDVTNVSRNFIEVLDKLWAAENTIQDSFAFIDNYQQERSETEIGDFWAGQREAAQQAYDRGQYGDSQLQQFIQDVFSSGKIAEMQNNAQQNGLTNQQTFTQQALDQMNFGQNFYGMWEQFANKSSLADVGNNGQISYNFGENGITSVDQLRQKIQEVMGVTAEFADAMIADAQLYSTDFKEALNNLSLEDSIAELLKGAYAYNNNGENKKILREENVNAFISAAGWGKEQADNFIAQLEAKDYKIVASIELKSEENIQNTLAGMLGESIEKGGAIQNGVVNMNIVYDALINLGLKDEEAKKQIANLIDNTNSQLGNTPFSINGEDYVRTGEELNAVAKYGGDVIEGATGEGLVNGILSTEASAAQQLSAIEQGETISIAVSQGIIAGATAPINSIINYLNNWITKLPLIGDKFSIPNIGSISMDTAANTILSKNSQTKQQLEALANQGSNNAGDAPDILGGMGNTTPSKATSYGSSVAQNAGKKGGTWEDAESSKDEEEPWKENYDWLYNLVEKTNEELRKRNKLEKEYDLLLQKNVATNGNLYENLQKQEESLKRQQEYYAQQLEGRLKEQKEIEAEYADVVKYAQYNESTGYVEIQHELIESVSGKQGNNELGNRIDEYIQKLETISDQIDTIEDNQLDIEAELEAINKQGQDDYLDIEQRIFDALVQLRQDEIDNLTDLANTINDSNTRVLDKIQIGIDDFRNARQMEEDRQNIQDLETKLSIMQSDTSGANALDILQVQEELRQARQDYTDSLIDKSIEEMTRQNSEAYDQRMAQIDLMTAQLEWDKENGVIANQTNDLLTQALQDMKVQQEIENLLKGTEFWKGMSAAEQDEWIETFKQGMASGLAWWQNDKSHSLASAGLSGQTLTFTDKTGKQQTGVVQSDGRVKVGNTYYDNIYRAPNGDWIQNTEGKTNTQKPPASKPPVNNTNNNKTIKVGGLINAGSAPIYSASDGSGKQKQYYRRDPIYKVLSERNGYVLTRYHKLSSGYTGWFKKSDVKAYKQGGLANFTGPAWLDGTKSKPEYILNAKQTEGWLKLTDILGNFNKIKTSEDIVNNYTYDIHIDVDKIENDYDVEQMMEKMKRLILDDANYRNVNAVQLGRR